MIEGLFTVVREVKFPPNTVLPPGKHNGRKNDAALAESCTFRVPFYLSIVLLVIIRLRNGKRSKVLIYEIER